MLAQDGFLYQAEGAAYRLPYEAAYSCAARMAAEAKRWEKLAAKKGREA